MILYTNGNILVKKIKTIHKDILIIQCQIYGLELRMILIYMSVSNYDTNKHLMRYIQDHIRNIKNYIILGDFNRHIGFLGPQPMNKNGELGYKYDRRVWKKTLVARIQEDGRRQWRNGFDINEKEQQYVHMKSQPKNEEYANGSVGAKVRLMVREGCLPVRGSKGMEI